MKSVQIGEFKAELSEIIHKVRDQGESFIIEYGKKHTKVAMLIPYQESLENQKPRTFGHLKKIASFEIHDDFDLTNDEFLGHE